MNLYNRRTGKIITIIGSDTIATESQLESEVLIDYKVVENVDEVFGKLCHVLIIKTNRRNGWYYYNDDYQIDPTVMAGHIYSSLSFIYSKTKALPLKIINRYPNFSSTVIAIGIEEKDLSDRIFELQ